MPGSEQLASHIRTELEKIKKRILYLGTSVEENLHRAVRALQNNDVELAHEVKISDLEIGKTEVSLEDQCLEVLALHQPVAGDLRFLVTVLKINIDLERIGDLAAKIADKVLLFSFPGKSTNSSSDHSIVHEKLNEMCNSTAWMLNKCLDAFARENADLAFRVILADDEVDKGKNMIPALLEETIQKDPQKNSYLGMLLSVSRCLERIADHATNICEDIIYMLEGKIVRHIIDNPETPKQHVY
jgi:phosphate transport system protein